MEHREVKQWITVNGKHIPIFEGESKADAYNRAVAKDNEDKKKADIEKADIEKKKINAEKSEGKKQSKKEQDEKFVNDFVQDILKSSKSDNPEEAMSMGDVDSVVMAYAIMHKYPQKDEDRLINAIRSKLDVALKAKNTSKSKKKSGWSSWNAGKEVTYTPKKDFDTVGTPKPIKGKVISVADDHAVVLANGMKLWVDEDTINMFK